MPDAKPSQFDAAGHVRSAIRQPQETDTPPSVQTPGRGGM
jgi:hypothetical protein